MITNMSRGQVKMANDQVAFAQMNVAASKSERNVRRAKIAHLKLQNAKGAGIIKSFMDSKCACKVVDLNKFDKDRDTVCLPIKLCPPLLKHNQISWVCVVVRPALGP
jgi:hypothetical protein